MARIVLVHGAGYPKADPQKMKSDWGRALHQGFERIGAPPPDPNTIDLAFYGHLYDRDPEEELAATQRPPSEFQISVAEDLAAKEGAAGLELWRFPTVQALFRFLDKRFHVGKWLLPFLVDVDAYFRDPGLRKRTIDVVNAVVDDREAVTIAAHSMGTIVSYEYLRQGKGNARQVRSFLSFGSPLWLPTIREKLGEPRPFPEGLKQWVNVYNKEDFATGEETLADLFPANDARKVVDRSSVGHPAGPGSPFAGHDPKGYLSSRGLAEPLRDLLQGKQVVG